MGIAIYVSSCMTLKVQEVLREDFFFGRDYDLAEIGGTDVCMYVAHPHTGSTTTCALANQLQPPAIYGTLRAHKANLQLTPRCVPKPYRRNPICYGV